MAIKVKYFANLRELIGRSEDSIEYRDGLSVAAIWDMVRGDEQVSMDYLAALNMEYTNNDTIVKDGDEVAFFPKVSGG